ncbi:SLATT domain-containing protein [Ideonella livida]|uniref:SLATT domain-containing protein n=1 Tax=Ideonella livida TaxID=2707176 RepID=A0A7C9TMZ8_9BURK|nr:SLATT domain-containing protein [Ideonella livida]NDY92767.1 SLATT domain-containing protein [Ideonella livida]
MWGGDAAAERRASVRLADTVACLAWAPGQRLASLATLAEAVREVVAGDVAYYRARQCRSKWWSNSCRVAAVGFGALGALQPLITQLWGQSGGPLACLKDTGQLWLMLGGLALVVDTVWAGTQAHGRYTSTVMALEAGMVRWTLAWQGQMAVLAGAEPDGPQTQRLIQSASDFLDAHHALMASEAGQWRGAMQEALAKAKVPGP